MAITDHLCSVTPRRASVFLYMEHHCFRYKWQQIPYTEEPYRWGRTVLYGGLNERVTNTKKIQFPKRIVGLTLTPQKSFPERVPWSILVVSRGSVMVRRHMCSLAYVLLSPCLALGGGVFTLWGPYIKSYVLSTSPISKALTNVVLSVMS